jgi:hypothetical protein
MQLDTISNIEQFVVDALLSSPHIPLGVNVIRLAATTDEEGITAMGKSIVVRYVNSKVDVTKRVPMTVERTMTFQLIHSAQSYLAESGHDAALQMCTGAYMSLSGGVPLRTGLSVLEPFSMSNETFDGLTDSSHYVYMQNWEITFTEINPDFNPDPCVYSGNCKELWPDEVTGTILPGDVIYAAALWSPVLPPPPGEDYEEELCGVEVRGTSLVYTNDPDQVFLQDWQRYELVSTNTTTADGKLLICNIHEDGEFIETYFAANCDERSLLGISTGINNGNGNDIVVKYDSALAWANVWPKTTIYHDPTQEDGPKTPIKYGWVVKVEVGTTLTVDGEEFYKTSEWSFGSGWVRTSDVTLYDRRAPEMSYCPDLSAENDGPEECA